MRRPGFLLMRYAKPTRHDRRHGAAAARVAATPRFDGEWWARGLGACFASLAAAAILGFSHVACSQSSITRFEDVAGKWTGHAFANNYRVSLEIDANGKFRARSLLGSERGKARLENGALVIPLVEHEGTLQLVLDGETLKGPGAVAGRTGTVTLVRADRTVRKE